MEDPATSLPVREFAIALFVGALVGIEREKAKGDKPGVAGVRTFILFAMVGAIAGFLTRALGTPWVLIGALACVTATVATSYFAQMRHAPDAPGLTTETAAIAVTALAGTATSGAAHGPEIAVGLGIALSALLAFKTPLHGAVGRISREDLYAGLKLLLLIFTVVPLLPDRTVDPWDALNPHKIGWLVVLISGLSLLGYVAVRWLGPTGGLAMTGVFGGLVSSTAVTLGLARREGGRGDARKGAHGADAVAGAILLAWTVMCVRVGAMVAVVRTSLLETLWPPLAAMAVATLGVAAFHLLRSAREKRPSNDVAVKNPFNVWSAVKFALVFSAVLVLVALVRRHGSGAGLYAVAAVAGLTDADAVTLSMADLAGGGGAAVATARNAIVVAAFSNTVAKCAIAAFYGGAALRARILVATGIVLAAGAAALLVS